jgi:hypothetical protein
MRALADRTVRTSTLSVDLPPNQATSQPGIAFSNINLDLAVNSRLNTGMDMQFGRDTLLVPEADLPTQASVGGHNDLGAAARTSVDALLSIGLAANRLDLFYHPERSWSEERHAIASLGGFESSEPMTSVSTGRSWSASEEAWCHDAPLVEATIAFELPVVTYLDDVAPNEVDPAFGFLNIDLT